MEGWSSVKLCDVANLGLGTILFFSSWLFGLSSGPTWQTASITGLFIAVLSMAALAAVAVWEEWLNLIAGLALIASPWLLGFQDSDAMLAQVVIGSIVAALAAFEVWLVDDRKRHGAAPPRPFAHSDLVRHQHAGDDGLELLPQAKALRPDVPIIMITAYGDAKTKRCAKSRGGTNEGCTFDRRAAELIACRL
jgi:CheY-like chemotaxis protein